MSQPTVTFTGNATQMLAEYKKLEEVRQKEVAQLKEVKAAYASAAKEEAALNRDATKLKEANLTSQDKYNRAMAKAGELLKANKITQADYNNELKRQSDLLGEGQSKMAGMAKDAIVAVTGIGSAMAGVAAIVSTIKAEYEDFKARAGESRATQLTFGEAMRDLASNFTPDASMGMGQLEGAVNGLVNRTGMSDRNAASALSAALSGRGSLSNVAAVQIAEQAGRVLPGDSEVTNQLALRTGQLMNSMGITDPREALGMIAQVKNVATVDKLRDVGQTAVPAMMSLKRHGDSPEQAAELFTAINLLMGDTEGSRSRTATEQLGQQLKEFLPGMGSTSARLAAMQSDPKQRAAFMQSANFETAAKTSMDALLSGSPEALAAMATAGQIAAPNVGSFESYVSGINSLSSQRVLANKARIDNAFNSIEKTDQAGSNAAEVIDIFDRAMGKTDFIGPDFATRQMSQMAFSSHVAAGMSPEASAIGQLQAARMVSNDTKWIDAALSKLSEIAMSTRMMSRGPSPEDALGRQPAGR